MNTILSQFDTWWKIFGAGVVSYPVGRYAIVNFGGAVWQVVKKFAYAAWDKIRSKV